MTENTLEKPVHRNSWWSKALAACAILALSLSLAGPATNSQSELELIAVGGTLGWLLPIAGPWAVLVHLTLPWAAVGICQNRAPKEWVWATVLLLATSPYFWVCLSDASLQQRWAPLAVATAVVLLVVAYRVR